MRIKINENFYQVDEKDLEKFKLEPTDRETLLTKIGKQIYEKRKRKSLTLKDVAKKIKKEKLYQFFDDFYKRNQFIYIFKFFF